MLFAYFIMCVRETNCLGENGVNNEPCCIALFDAIITTNPLSKDTKLATQKLAFKLKKKC